MIEIHNIKIIEIIFIIMVCLVPFHLPAAEFAGGTGELNEPYQISTAEQLISIGDDPNLLYKHFMLVNDIDLDPNLLGGQVFTQAIIAPNGKFSGCFDGNGYKIINLTIHISNDEYHIGLFGRVNKKGRICNLGLEDLYISGDDLHYTGGLVGDNVGVIDNCYTTGSISCSGGTDIGGLVGGHSGDSGIVVLIENTKGSITNCYSNVNIICKGSTTWVGGLAGSNSLGTITNCFVKASVNVGNDSSQVGGLVGENQGIIISCYSNGTISGGNSNRNVGGLVGNAWGESRIINCYSSATVLTGDNCSRLGSLVGKNRETIANCYSIGTVSCGENCQDIGGLVGDGSAYNSFWNTETSGTSTSDGGIGLTTAQMLDARTYLDAGWDFIDERGNGTSDMWRIPEGGGYPELAIFSEDYQPHTLAGIGTPENPYKIGAAEDLGAMYRYDNSACYKLVADVNLSGIKWSLAPVDLFNGSFDGDSHCITNLTIYSHGPDLVGLFSLIGSDSKISNFGLEDVVVNASDSSEYIGGLAGRNYGDITHCYVTGSFSLGNECKEIGVLVGTNSGNINNSYSTGSISTGESSYMTGVLAGYSDSDITNCYADTNISVGDNSRYIGGLIGYKYDSGYITNCYSIGEISIGDNHQDIGGLVGYSWWNSRIISSYFLSEPEGDGLDNGLGFPLTDEQMKQQASFIGWDFDDVWTICEGVDYPRLQWENIQCKEEE